MKNRDAAIEFCKFFETILKSYGANGRGLHEKVTSVEEKLPPKLTRGLRRIATIRNEQLHESNAPDFELEKFVLDALNLAFSLGKLQDSFREPTGASISEVATSIASLTTNVEATTQPVNAEPVDDKAIEEELKTMALGYSQSELEELIDDSITKAHAVHYEEAYEPWHGFIYLAKETIVSREQQLKLLSLAVAAGAELADMLQLAKELNLPTYTDSLASEFRH